MKGCQSGVRYLAATFDIVSAVSSSYIFFLNNFLSLRLSRKKDKILGWVDKKWQGFKDVRDMEGGYLACVAKSFADC